MWPPAVGGYKILGENGHASEPHGAGDNAGQSVAGIGDVNGDAIPDLLIGAPGHAASYVVFGKADNAKVNLDDVALGSRRLQDQRRRQLCRLGWRRQWRWANRLPDRCAGRWVSWFGHGISAVRISLAEVDSWQRAATGSTSRASTDSLVGDLNGDGRADLVVPNFFVRGSTGGGHLFVGVWCLARADGAAGERRIDYGRLDSVAWRSFAWSSITRSPHVGCGDRRCHMATGCRTLLVGHVRFSIGAGVATTYVIDGQRCGAQSAATIWLEGGAGNDDLNGGWGDDTLDPGVSASTPLPEGLGQRHASPRLVVKSALHSAGGRNRDPHDRSEWRCDR
jgi:hypothetical protein